LIWKSYEGNWPWLPEFRDLVPVSSGASTTISAAPRSRPDDVGLTFEGMISVPTLLCMPNVVPHCKTTLDVLMIVDTWQPLLTTHSPQKS
jgi:hypothetical protein